MQVNEFIYLANVFLDKLFAQLALNQIKIDKHWSIDHLCYRVSTEEAYKKFKNEFSSLGNLLIESEVNGRLISTFKLHKAIQYHGWLIDLVELPAPKKGKQTIEGFEHAEVVIDIPFEEIKRRYSHCQFDESGLKKNLNKELEIKLKDLAIKFHHMSLEQVIEVEKKI